jgi:CO/xanthine dehydrogenase FAD-binding subunit
VPTNLKDALEALRSMPNAQIVAGGTDLMVEVNFNRRKVTDVIALRRVSELNAWTVSDDGNFVTIGSGVPYLKMESGEIANLLPALAQAARTVGSPQIRAVATLGGNLGTCSPAGDGLPVLFALDAVVHLHSASNNRHVSIHDFMVGVKRNIRNSDEIITAVTLPVRSGWQGYAKVGVRNAMVIATASACLSIDKINNSAHLALGSVGPTIIRCRKAEAWVALHHDLASSTPIATEVAKEFGDIAASEARPIDDHRSTAQYRRHAISTMSRRLMLRAFPNE